MHKNKKMKIATPEGNIINAINRNITNHIVCLQKTLKYVKYVFQTFSTNTPLLSSLLFTLISNIFIYILVWDYERDVCFSFVIPCHTRRRHLCDFDVIIYGHIVFLNLHFISVFKCVSCHLWGKLLILNVFIQIMVIVTNLMACVLCTAVRVIHTFASCQTQHRWYINTFFPKV